MNAFLQTLRNLGPMRLAAIAVVALSLLMFFGFLTTRISSAPMSLLYTELDQQDAGAVLQKLDSMKVPYEVSSTGGMIRVPSDQVGKVRMMLAGQGLPRGGNIGYEIFDQKEEFGTTSFVQNINHLRALEGELARTITSIDAVQSARVHLVLPQRELFSHNSQAASASVSLRTRGGVTLTREQIASIQHLVASSVPQLQAAQVAIIDEQGNLLARPAGADGASANQDDMRIAFEQAQARKIEELLSQTLGYGKVRAQVSADLDLDKITTSSEIYDPDSQVVRSTQSTAEETSNNEGGPEGVSIANNLPATTSQPQGAGALNKTSHSEETVNYEINKTVRNQVREQGQVKRLSVAVVVDGTWVPGAKEGDAATYQARTPEEMEKIKSLVRSAVNFDETRGDTLEVANLPFAQSDPSKKDNMAGDLLMGVPKTELLHVAETVLLAIIGLLVVLLIVRPILRRLFENAGQIVTEQQQLLTAGGYAAAQLPAPGDSMSQDYAPADDEEAELEKMIDVSRVEGRVRASSLRKVGEIVDKHPEEAVSILRNWIYSENR